MVEGMIYLAYANPGSCWTHPSRWWDDAHELPTVEIHQVDWCLATSRLNGRSKNIFKDEMCVTGLPALGWRTDDWRRTHYECGRGVPSNKPPPPPLKKNFPSLQNSSLEGIFLKSLFGTEKFYDQKLTRMRLERSFFPGEDEKVVIQQRIGSEGTPSSQVDVNSRMFYG